MKRFSLIAIAGIVASIAFFSCKDNNNLEKYRKEELALLNAYISTNYPNEQPKPSGLYYIEETKGTGDSIKIGDRVQIFYATWSVDSILLDETSGFTKGYEFEPFEFIVGSGKAIAGLDEAATYMQQGTVANLVIPSELAYGQNGNSSGIVGFTTLLMQVKVDKIYRANSN